MSKCLELSFVTKRPGRNGGLNFWGVDHSGGFQEQWRRGELMALEALDLMVREDDDGLIRNHLLGWVALDMESVGEDRRVRLGFMNCIGAFAVAARGDFGDEWFRQYLEKADAALDAVFASEKARRSEHARKAANARWAKRKNVVEGPWAS